MNFRVFTCEICGCCAAREIDNRKLCPECILSLELSKDPFDHFGGIKEEKEEK